MKGSNRKAGQVQRPITPVAIGDASRLRVWRAMDEGAPHALATTLAAGAAHYERTRILPRLLPVDAGHVDALGARRIRLMLLRALRKERARRNHWTYDLNRHIALAQALKAELALNGERAMSG